MTKPATVVLQPAPVAAHRPTTIGAAKPSGSKPAVDAKPDTKKTAAARNGSQKMILAGVAVVALIAAAWFFLGGPSKADPADLRSFLNIPAGHFIYQEEGSDPNAEPKNTKEFWIGKYEVTIGQYKEFWQQVKAKGDAEYAHKQQPKEKDRTHTPRDWDKILQACDTGAPYMGQQITCDYPVFNVDYYDAWAYANWAGGRLPTEMEWEKAARGVYGRLYPWGNTPNPKLANTGADFSSGTAATVDGYHQWSPVNAHPGDVSPYGVRGMAGNVAEWTDSWEPMKSNPSRKAPVIRGGSWADKDVKNTHRKLDTSPTQVLPHLGFRIVKDREPEIVAK
jgi:formylglycine-generating enzyme required for sulfatase activity